MNQRIVQIEFFISFLLLAVIVGLVFIAAVMRFFDHPIIWSIDLAKLLFIWLCFAGAVSAMRNRAHLGVDFFIRKLSYDNRLIVETILAVIFVVFLGVLAWVGSKLTMMNIERVFGDSGLSYAFVTISVPVGCILLSLVIITNALQAWKSKESSQILIFSRPDSLDQ